jgi:hypothetical protein
MVALLISRICLLVVCVCVRLVTVIYLMFLCCTYILCYLHRGARGSVSWLRHYATSRKVAGWIPDEVTGFFI